MRGTSDSQYSLPICDPGEYVPAKHPIRDVKVFVDDILERMSPAFDAMYSAIGRKSIPPEVLLKSCMLIALYSIRSERQFCEQLDYNMLFRWFLDMNLNDRPFDASVFAKNKSRLLESGVATEFFEKVRDAAMSAGLMSSDHFTVDGTLIEAWASLKSFRPRDGSDEDRDTPDDPGNPTVNFHNEKRSNSTHQSTTDPEALLAKKGKGKEAKLSYSAHAMMENRNGLIVDFRVSSASGTAERDEAIEMIREQKKGGVRVKTVGADKGYDVRSFVEDVRNEGVTPHIAAKRSHGAIDKRTTRHKTYAVSQRYRKRVEEIFGWMKTIGGFRRTRYRGTARTGLMGLLVATTYNVIRITKLLRTAA
jgi:transposase